MDNIAIIGLGLIGGSICRGLKKRFSDITINGYGRDLHKLEPALKERAVDSINTIEEFAPDIYDLIIVSVPVAASIGLINNILSMPDYQDYTITIDVGSVKAPIMDGISISERAGRFIGCHPMVGSEESGYNAGYEDMFENASVIITPGEFNSSRDIETVSSFWSGLGAKVTIMSARFHDLAVAYTSHLPHIVSCYIVHVLMKHLRKESPIDSVEPLIGKGFQDVTRLSSGSPEVWEEIIELNKNNITDSLSELIKDLEDFKKKIDRDKIDSREVFNILSDIKDFKDKIS